VYPVKKLKLLSLILESFGVFTLFIIFSIYVDAFLSKTLGFVGVMLFWLSYGFFGAVVAYIIRRFKGSWTWRDLGFKIHRSWKKDIWYGFVIFALCYFITIPFQIIFIPSVSKQISQQLGFLQQMSLPIALLAVTGIGLIIGFITGAFHEEIRYRGYLQGLFSKEIAPAFGFFVSLIPFSLGHYFSHPEWTLMQILNTLPLGIAICLGYYASRSLLVVMSIHTIANLLLVYAPYLYSRGYIQSSYAVIFLLGVFFIIICILSKNEVKELLIKSKELFKKSGLKMSIVGILFGFVFLFVIDGLRLLKHQMDQTAYILLLVVFSVFCLGLSFLKRNKIAQK